MRFPRMCEEAVDDLAFILDVDNTLLDNDGVKAELEAGIRRLVGADEAAHFWEAYEEVRQEADYVDFPRTLHRFHERAPEVRRFAEVAAFVLFYPYENARFPGALDAIAHLRSMGTVAIVSDGDPVFQPAKIARAGLAVAVEDNVLIYVHKEEHLEEIMERFPARRYVLVDDKPRILAAVKARRPDRIMTLHVCQGSYAHAEEHDLYPGWDRALAHIGDLVHLQRTDFLNPAPA